MPRQNRSHERRAELLPQVAAAFAELGYRRTTTAELAARCEVQEVALYRLWPDKRAMFLAALDHVWDASAGAWEKLLTTRDARSPAERLLAHEATHHGEHGLYRLIFAGLSETDDPEIRSALARLYERFHQFVERRVAEHRGEPVGKDAAASAWALIGLGTAGSISKELGLTSPADRKRLWDTAGSQLLGRRGRA